MTMVDGEFPSFVSGVSEQAENIRLASQVGTQTNALSSLTEGLTKRPNTEYIAKLTGLTDESGAMLHVINRDASNQHIAFVRSSGIKVFDLDGSERVVNNPNGIAYLSTGTAADLRAVTVADYTFILNRTVVPAIKSGSKSPAQKDTSLVYVKQGNFGKTYTVTISSSNVNGSVSHSTPDWSGDNGGNESQVDSAYIATQLRSSLASNFPNLTFNLIGSVIHIEDTNAVAGGDLSVSTEDGFGNTSMVGLNASGTQNFTDLPRKAPANYVIRITGDPSNAFDDYYVKWVKEGEWIEAVAPDLDIEIDPASMPHALIRQPNGEFNFEQLSWAPREAGDDDSVPFPSFIGRTLGDIFFFRNRLGVTSDENVILSAASDFFNFFPTTATSILDGDPIDVQITATKVSVLEHAVPFNETVMLGAENAQFTINTPNNLTPSTIAIDRVTDYSMSKNVRPIGCGTNVYGGFERGSSAGVREFLIGEDAGINTSDDVTAHCPTYIPSGLSHFTCNGDENFIAALTSGETNAIYTYKFHYERTEKRQSAWSKWKMADDVTILGCEFLGNDLYLILQRADGIFFEKVRLEDAPVDSGKEWKTLLDSRLRETDCALVHNGVTDKTTIQLPYGAPSDNLRVVGLDGATIPIESVSTPGGGFSTITVDGDKTSDTFYVGQPYEMNVQLSRPQLRLGGQENTRVITDHRLTITKMHLMYARTGHFDIEVSNERGRLDTYKMRSAVTGLTEIGTPTIEDGEFNFGVLGRNTDVTITLKSDSHFPTAILSGQWEGQYNKRASRLST